MYRYSLPGTVYENIHPAVHEEHDSHKTAKIEKRKIHVVSMNFSLLNEVHRIESRQYCNTTCDNDVPTTATNRYNAGSYQQNRRRQRYQKDMFHG